jgi:hypothetical protein
MAINSFANIDYTLPTNSMTLLSTTTLTGASITLSSIPATYNDLRLVVRNFVPVTDGNTLRMRFNGNTGSVYASTNIGTPASGTFGFTSMTVSGDTDNAVTSSLVSIDIPDYANTVSWKLSRSLWITVNNTTPTNGNLASNIGAFNQTGAIDSITLFAVTGNLTSGTALLYGVK